MADLWITECSGSGREGMQVFQARRGQVRQKKTIGTEVKTNPFGQDCFLIRLKAAGADCIYVISDPDSSGNFEAATTTVGEYLSSGDIEYVGVRPGQALSVISTTGS